MAPRNSTKSPRAGDTPSADSKEQDRAEFHELVETQRYRDIWTFVVGVRILNALTLATFFQPDEFYQALEPAWQIAFGKTTGAWNGPWITWEWHHQLRPALYPTIIAGIYKATYALCDLMFPTTLTSNFLVTLPRLFFALSAAVHDYFIWMLADRIYGHRSQEGTAALAMLIFSPWQWYVSTRSLSNCMEATLTATALYYWPWSWFLEPQAHEKRQKDASSFKYCAFLIGLACLLRPTNALLWLPLAAQTFPHATTEEFFGALQSASIYGSIALGISQAADRWYYGEWTLTALQWFNFNISQNLAVHYGVNRLDYYFTEGIPLLLIAAVPFALIGLVQALTGRYSYTPDTAKPPVSVLRSLAITALIVPIVLSFISHKEVRFLYPIFSLLTVLAARPVVAFFWPFPPASNFKRTLLAFIALLNLTLSIYLSFFHNRGLIGVTSFLRHEFEALNYPTINTDATINSEDLEPLEVGFLMPCHSTPWRSHLVYRGIDAWALQCEPPIGASEAARKKYADEADRFYEDPILWLGIEFVTRQRTWPKYVVFFEQLEPTMKEFITTGAFYECWRGFNSLIHDDWRRQGDVIVWCLKESFGGHSRQGAVGDAETETEDLGDTDE